MLYSRSNSKHSTPGVAGMSLAPQPYAAATARESGAGAIPSA